MNSFGEMYKTPYFFYQYDFVFVGWMNSNAYNKLQKMDWESKNAIFKIINFKVFLAFLERSSTLPKRIRNSPNDISTRIYVNYQHKEIYLTFGKKCERYVCGQRLDRDKQMTKWKAGND